MENLTSLRGKINGLVYRKIVRPICFRFDAERIHNIFIKTGKFLGSSIATKRIIAAMYNYQNKILEQNILGIKFRNPVGLSAGFDKNGESVVIMEDIGFGFVEVGSITAKPSFGNSGKRLDRIKDKQSLWVHLGLNNEGVETITKRLKKIKYIIPIGINIAKTNCKETANAKVGLKDYLISLKKANEKKVGNYFVLNISCPNSYGGQQFSQPELYHLLLKETDKLKIKKPVFVKLSPDLNKKDVDRLINISRKFKVIKGFIISNLTKKHNYGKGGLSGKIVEDKANSMLKYVYKKTKGAYILIGVGGIFSAEDAYKKIRSGANLVELITGMVYQGPQLISEINYGLVKLLQKDGYKSITAAVGADFN